MKATIEVEFEIDGELAEKEIPSVLRAWANPRTITSEELEGAGSDRYALIIESVEIKDIRE